VSSLNASYDCNFDRFCKYLAVTTPTLPKTVYTMYTERREKMEAEERLKQEEEEERNRREAEKKERKGNFVLTNDLQIIFGLSGLVNFEFSLKFFRVGGKKSNFNSGGCFNSIAVLVISIETVRLHQGCPVKSHFGIIFFW
jgi:hypothetical protein